MIAARTSARGTDRRAVTRGGRSSGPRERGQPRHALRRMPPPRLVRRERACGITSGPRAHAVWAQRQDLRWATRHASVDVPVLTGTVTLRSIAPVHRVALALVALLGCRVARGPATADAAREAPTRMLWQTTRQYASVEHHEPDGTLDVTFGAQGCTTSSAAAAPTRAAGGRRSPTAWAAARPARAATRRRSTDAAHRKSPPCSRAPRAPGARTRRAWTRCALRRSMPSTSAS